MTLRIIACTLGLITGNYIFQAFNAHDWALAGDRSFFQAMAMLALWVSVVLAPGNLVTQDNRDA